MLSHERAKLAALNCLLNAIGCGPLRFSHALLLTANTGRVGLGRGAYLSCQENFDRLPHKMQMRPSYVIIGSGMDDGLIAPLQAGRGT
jgi:hypothetical protein